ncbi:MAG TPA: L-glutamate gamma-semialdehyde dehydrogenase [Saprospiraceae bacterium]|nr:L-glutamate gamma-semialdehyde dehydrogenase [Saprospiraceae bacterium]
MSNAHFKLPSPYNEPVLNYAPGSPEKLALKKALKQAKARQKDVPMIINGRRVRTKNKISIHPPHELAHTLGHYYQGDATHVKKAIDAAMKAKPAWEATPWQDRAAIFLKAADLLSGPYRAKMNAATMLCQSKTVFQAEIDAVCELADFFRYNATYMSQIYKEQPDSSKDIWNRMEYRALEGFIFALTPFNFTSIAGNLPSAPAIMGNTVVWKAAGAQVYSASVIMEVLMEAGLPDGVINLIFVSGPVAGEVIFKHRDFGGLHFTGSTGTFNRLWHTISENIPNYKSYPRIVGETGGKDFVMVHKSADAKTVATALLRGAFEYQGQKCSAASRAYIPKSLWPRIEKFLKTDVDSIATGTPEDFRNFFTAVIDEKAYDKITKYIKDAQKTKAVQVITGGEFSKKTGYFIQPTILLTKDPNYVTMEEEIFGPVLTIYVYDDKKYEKTLDLLDSTSPYGLTGAVFAKDKAAIALAYQKLQHAAGNFYINDKPTGAVVGQQPFGGARKSGTNDKAGSVWNLLRWVSPRAIKENFNPPTDYRYPFMAEE